MGANQQVVSNDDMSHAEKDLQSCALIERYGDAWWCSAFTSTLTIWQAGMWVWVLVLVFFTNFKFLKLVIHIHRCSSSILHVCLSAKCVFCLPEVLVVVDVETDNARVKVLKPISDIHPHKFVQGCGVLLCKELCHSVGGQHLLVAQHRVDSTSTIPCMLECLQHLHDTQPQLRQRRSSCKGVNTRDAQDHSHPRKQAVQRLLLDTHALCWITFLFFVWHLLVAQISKQSSTLNP